MNVNETMTVLLHDASTGAQLPVRLGFKLDRIILYDYDLTTRAEIWLNEGVLWWVDHGHTVAIPEPARLSRWEVVTAEGKRVWHAEDVTHAIEQHDDAFSDEPILSVSRLDSK